MKDANCHKLIAVAMNDQHTGYWTCSTCEDWYFSLFPAPRVNDLEAMITAELAFRAYHEFRPARTAAA